MLTALVKRIGSGTTLLTGMAMLCFAGNASPAAAQACVPPPSGGMQFWLPADSPDFRVAKVPAGFTGSYTGAVLPVLGRWVGSPDLAIKIVTADGRMDFPANPALNFGTGDFSIDAWVKTASTGLNPLIDNRAGSIPNLRGVQLYVYQGKIGLQMADAGTGGGYSNFTSTAPSITDNNWHHVAVTVDRDLATGGVIYVDGSPVLTFNPLSRQGDLGTNQPMAIGHNMLSGVGQLFEIDEIEFFNRVLTQAEVLSLKQNPKCK